ncbi:MAG: hypothetical protein K2X82_03560 [Gemmataceae bacterium]|nr:hypothetical protein [Gemmataceae bacterium]
MPLAHRVGNRPHTVRAFRAAAGARYRDGVALAEADRPLGAVYVLGYAAEMLLKAAYFRLRGWGPRTPITFPHLTAARDRAVNALGVPWTDRLHDLDGWAGLLVAERAHLGRPLPARLRRRLTAEVRLIYSHWRESLRYHDARPYAAEVAGTRAAAGWLFRHFRYL